MTSWSGQYLPDRETLSATWLLTRPSAADGVWESTVIGQDIFQRSPFSADDVAKHTGSGRPHSHPQSPAGVPPPDRGTGPTARPPNGRTDG
ncbi:hypothetical protein GCM10025734_24010 [Kitasatospora paranensis]